MSWEKYLNMTHLIQNFHRKSALDSIETMLILYLQVLSQSIRLMFNAPADYDFTNETYNFRFSRSLLRHDPIAFRANSKQMTENKF